MMKRNISISFFAVLGIVAAAGAGIAIYKSNQAQPIEASAYADTYYLVGRFDADHSDYSDLGNWNNGEKRYPVANNSSTPVVFHFTQWASNTKRGDEFKFVPYNDWDGALGIDNLQGSAAGCFSANGTNIYTEVTGYYAVYIADGTLYIDYADNQGWNYLYTGSDKAKSDDGNSTWTGGWTAHPVTLGGSAVTFDLGSGEELKFKRPDTWSGELNWNALGTDDSENSVDYNYYRCFKKADGNNIKVNKAGSYDVRVYVDNHAVKLSIIAHNPQTVTCYVLDLNGDLLGSTHNAHYFNNDYGIATKWPGLGMPKYGTSRNIYTMECWDQFAEVIFNNGTTQTIRHALSGHINKCLILEWAYSEQRWTSSTWLSIGAASFIDSHMKFETAHENAGEGSGLCKSQGWYEAAKTAYIALSPEIKAEITGYAMVSDRLAAWAEANSENFTITDGVGSFLPRGLHTAFFTSQNQSAIAIGIIVSITAFAAALGFIVSKKKRHSFN